MAGSGFENNLVYAINADFSNATNPAIANGLATDNQVWMGDTAGNANGSHALVKTVTAGTGINFVGSSASTFVINSNAASTDLHTARFIVSAGGAADGANFTTIATAVAAAVAATGVQTVFIQPGTYTENLTLSANINLSAYTCDQDTPNVTIVGKMTMNYTGSATYSGINFQTNSDFAITSTTNQSTNPAFWDCVFTAANNTAINWGNTSGGFFITYSTFRISTTGIADFAIAGGNHVISFCNNSNSGNSLTANTISAGSIILKFCQFQPALTTSGTAELQAVYTQFGNNRTPQNLTQLTVGGSGTHNVDNCLFLAGTASAISVSVGQTLNLSNSSIKSTNAAAIAGAGTLNYTNVSFPSTSNVITTTTTTGTYTDLGKSFARKQPSFLAYMNTIVNNVTGDGTVYTIIYDTEVFDQGNDFNLGTSTFTAPVTGNYHFDLQVLLAGGTTITSGQIRIVIAGTSAATYNRTIDTVAAGTTSVSGGLSIILPMTATDTCVFQVLATDGGGKVDDVSGVSGALRRNYACGYLVC